MRIFFLFFSNESPHDRGETPCIFFDLSFLNDLGFVQLLPLITNSLNLFIEFGNLFAVLLVLVSNKLPKKH